ncbi:CIA30 family protein [Halomonas urmiana]|uniref:CIA30 family protein n=1 Tax=Halomonas urmiana TaxID=490901 RepID=A0A5R8MM54_9GAMM|nr:CIA30 family protein [Halomonas urmiana]TLF53322.1 CIA30 family protein [Halomonas urmiana]
MPPRVDFRIDFQDTDEAGRWHAINDGVMGGVSQGRMQIAAGIGVFTGRLSLVHGGGFASVRREPGDPALGGARGIRLRVRGDGRTYQLLLRTDRLFEGAAYRTKFTTSGEWQSLGLDWDDFEAVFRGRRLEDAPPLAPQDIRQFGFLIADHREGAFRLEIAALEALA